MALDELEFGTIGGVTLSLAEALRLLKRERLLDAPPKDWIATVVERTVLAQEAAAAGLQPSGEEIQGLMRTFREARGLHSAADTHAFLQQHGCTPGDFGAVLEAQWQEAALRQSTVEPKVQEQYLRHQPQYDTALLSELVVESEDLARELLLQIEEEGSDFAGLALRYSLAPTAATAGFRGEVRRGALRAAECAAVFAAPPGDVVGPFESGRRHTLLKVHASHRAELTPALRTEISNQLWTEWLADRITAARPQITCLAEL